MNSTTHHTSITFGARNNYSLERVTDYSFVVSSSSGSGLVCFPKLLVKEWIDAYKSDRITKTMSAREKREILKHNSEWASQMHSFETHLNGLLEGYLDGTIPPELFEVQEQGPANEPSQPLDSQSEALLETLTHQAIYQGPPGTGKSYKVQELLHSVGLSDESPQVERIVGHPELTSADFLGSYRPSTEGGTLHYSFVPGPFVRLLRKARASAEKPHILVLEELNRTNAAALFADVFQLLDRYEDGRSVYPTNLGKDINHHLGLEEDAKVRLPSNLFILATMNTADQGVFPLDTAFKRRWTFHCLGVEDGSEVWWSTENGWNPKIPNAEDLRWQELRLWLNQTMAEQGIQEDRHLGAFFLAKRELRPERVEENILNKVIAYLRDDVLRYEPYKLFAQSEGGQVEGFGSLRKKMRKNGLLSIFKKNPNAETIRAAIRFSNPELYESPSTSEEPEKGPDSQENDS